MNTFIPMMKLWTIYSGGPHIQKANKCTELFLTIVFKLVLQLKHKANIMQAGHNCKVDQQTLECTCVRLV